MLRPKWQQWLFGKNGGILSPEIKSPWGIFLLFMVLVLIVIGVLK